MSGTGPGMRFRGKSHAPESFYSPREKRRIKKGQIHLDINIRSEEDVILNRITWERLASGEYPRVEKTEDKPGRCQRVVHAVLNWHRGPAVLPATDVPDGDEDQVE